MFSILLESQVRYSTDSCYNRPLLPFCHSIMTSCHGGTPMTLVTSRIIFSTFNYHKLNRPLSKMVKNELISLTYLIFMQMRILPCVRAEKRRIYTPRRDSYRLPVSLFLFKGYWDGI